MFEESSEDDTLPDRFDVLKKFVLNNDAASLQSALDVDPDRTAVLKYYPFGYEQFPLLILAAEKNFVDIAKLLLRARANVNQLTADHNSSLIVAARSGNDEMVTLLLLQPKVKIDTEDQFDRTALMFAAEEGHASIVQQLLEARAKVGYSLIAAARGGHCHLLELLLQHKADIHARDRTGDGCLHAAAREGHTDAASFLLKANAAVDMLGCHGITPLMDACTKGSLSIVRLLLAAGANVNQRDSDRGTALHSACAAGSAGSARQRPIVDEVLKAGAEPNAADSRGITALNLVVIWSEQMGTMALLLNAKADIDLADRKGDTPLIRATSTGRAPSVKFLLQNGANLLKKGRNSTKQTARQCGNDETRALFECTLCGWQGMCCFNCREKYCVVECDKFSDKKNFFLENTVNCRLHQKVAHQSVLEWTLAMSSLNLPPYVLEIIFNALKLNSTHKDYQQRKAIDFVSIAKVKKMSSKIKANFIHLIIEERTHLQNINMFIAIQKAYQKSQENNE